MGSDFSALDAELDQVGAGPEVDAVSLANHYAGDLRELTAIDSALAELGEQVDSIDPAAFARELPVVAATSLDAPARAPAPAAKGPESKEIALPDAPLRTEADRSQELALDPAPRSGSFELDQPAEQGGQDDVAVQAQPPADTADSAGADELRAVSSSPPPAATARAPSARPQARPHDVRAGVEPAREAHASTRAQNGSEARDSTRDQAFDDEDEAVFAALFGELTRQSGAADPSRPPDLPEEDTEIFDSAAFARATQNSRDSDDEVELNVEELDSAEFEVLTETAVSRPGPPSSPPARSSSRPPGGKRPSFLGRLFGRKEE